MKNNQETKILKKVSCLKNDLYAFNNQAINLMLKLKEYNKELKSLWSKQEKLAIKYHDFRSKEYYKLKDDTRNKLSPILKKISDALWDSEEYGDVFWNIWDDLKIANRKKRKTTK